MIELRDYQHQLVSDIRAKFATVRRVLAVAGTGSGKTVVFSYLTRATAAKGNSVTIVAHRAEITKQISAALDAMGVRHGRIQRGHKLTDDPVQVGMIQTVWNRMSRIQKPNMLIIDEAHHAVAGSWNRLTDAWKGVYILGVTATPERLDGRGLREAFDEMVLAPPVRDLIEAGHLARYRYLAPPADIDLSGVSEHGGDYDIGELAEAMDKRVITGSAVEHYRKYLNGRPAIAFCTTVAHAQHVAEQFAEAGFRAASVDGTMSQPDRQERLSGIGDGRLNVLTSCELISEGVDVPVVSGAILLRPTRSLAFHLQTVGRVLRPKPDGSEAIILDHVGNFRTHGLPDDPRAWTLDSKRRTPKAAAGTTQCEVCYTVFSTASPTWKASAECPLGNDPFPEDCILIPEEGTGRLPPPVIDGALEELQPAVIPPPSAILVTDWSDGVCIRTGPFKHVLRLARTREQLQQMAQARGYNPQWVRRILSVRASREPAADIPFVPAPPAPVRHREPADELEYLLS